MQSDGSRIVGQWVVDVVGEAEARWDAGLDPLRRAAERLQDENARVAPLEAYASDWSVGRYNMRPQTVRAALDRLIADGAGGDYGFERPLSDDEIVSDIMDTSRDSALVKVILATLRAEHPQLQTMSWDEIERSDQAIAKLYSGYLGAGGDWAAWRASMTPGSVAIERLGCNEDGTRCSVVDEQRPGG
ncbi:MAG: hypothetical protein ACRDJE_25585 [Dehalococcoidia bacterium]